MRDRMSQFVPSFYPPQFLVIMIEARLFLLGKQLLSPLLDECVLPIFHTNSWVLRKRGAFLPFSITLSYRDAKQCQARRPRLRR